jgi:folate-binding protein YgfZ
MNRDWQSYLLERPEGVADKHGISFHQDNPNHDKVIYPLTHLGAISVSGADAARLLQGQITCNVNDVSPFQSKLAAMCNPKGRAIATFIVIQTGDYFLLVLPVELIETIQKKLQMYVLRSDVKITDVTSHYGFLGVSESGIMGKAFDAEVKDDIIEITLPGESGRNLLIGPVETLITYWRQCLEAGTFHEADTPRWRLLDLMAGIPWLTLRTSEEFIPQMLNLDKLGGISFTKGCYTGQEIVARTHYLGKNKRDMVLAEGEFSCEPKPNSAVIIAADPEQQAVGHVLMAQRCAANWKLLLILQTGQSGHPAFRLRDYPEIQLRLIPFSV